MEKIETILSDLTSCHEEELKENVLSSFKKVGFDVRSDRIGNIIAHKKGTGPNIMVIAHADTIKLMVVHIDESGFLYLKPYGAIDPNILPAREIAICHNGTIVPGIIGKKPYHLMRDETSATNITCADIWVDIGAKSKDEVETMVEIGDYAYFCGSLQILNNRLVSGKYLDNRIGIAVLLQIATRISADSLPWNLYFVASAQEELGGRGAVAAAEAIRPDCCIVIDVTHATDYPSMSPIQNGDIKLDKGCVITRGANINDEMFRQFKAIAQSSGIPYQIEAIPSQCPSDANLLQMWNCGIAVAQISIPCRYMHTPHEVVSFNDAEAASKLIAGYLLDKSKETITNKR